MLHKAMLLFSLCLFATICLAPGTAAGEEVWGVHLASYRTQSRAQEGWVELQARHQELLASLDCRFVPVSIPGKGDYLRIIAGSFADRGQARALEHALKVQGAYAAVMPCQLEASSARNSEASHRPAASSSGPVAAATAAPVAPAPPQVKAPRAPKVAAPKLSATGESKASQNSGKGLRKYVPAPVVDSFKAVLQPLSPSEQEFRENLPPLPDSSTSNFSGKNFHVGFKDDDSMQDGLTLANTPDRNSRISAQYGNMENDYETVNRISPLSAGDNSGSFKPYLGFGLHF